MTHRLNVTALRGVYLTVSDARRSAAWFERHFGMTGVPYGDFPSVKLPEGGAVVLVETSQRNVYESSPFHFKCNDARLAHGELTRQAVRATEPVNWHHYVDFNFFDPDGNPIAVISDPGWRPHPNNYFRMDGIFMGSTRLEQSLAWYLDVFGAEIEYDFTLETASSPHARMCCLRGVPFTLFESPGGLVHHRFCDFATRDAVADYHYLLDKGVRVTPLVRDETRFGFSFIDPEGREMGLVEEKE
ncbi:VOC family protein [Paenibacillus cymbidii]|uniref:VOC family protein n=1 Tax=Paenibacillus cymbidii TaxID=1639034 RepID=UPI001081EE12|nr:VOC family protein [Paenibacillus cymbidii]